MPDWHPWVLQVPLGIWQMKAACRNSVFAKLVVTLGLGGRTIKTSLKPGLAPSAHHHPPKTQQSS